MRTTLGFVEAGTCADAAAADRHRLNTASVVIRIGALYTHFIFVACRTGEPSPVTGDAGAATDQRPQRRSASLLMPDPRRRPLVCTVSRRRSVTEQDDVAIDGA